MPDCRTMSLMTEEAPVTASFAAARVAVGSTESDRLPRELVRLALTLMLGAVMVALDMTMVNVALDTLVREFHTSVATIQWVSTVYLMSLAMVIPLTRWAVERFGAKPVWIASIVAYIAGSMLCGIAWSAGSLIAFRVVQGAGGGMILPLIQTVLAR